MIQIEMEMADKCSECRFQTEYEFCSAMPKNFCGNTSDEGKPDWCPLNNADGWISVKDRLPEPQAQCLVYSDKARRPSGMETATYTNLGWMVAAYFPEITHWMPLPEPPKEDSDD